MFGKDAFVPRTHLANWSLLVPKYTAIMGMQCNIGSHRVLLFSLKGALPGAANHLVFPVWEKGFRGKEMCLRLSDLFVC